MKKTKLMIVPPIRVAKRGRPTLVEVAARKKKPSKRVALNAALKEAKAELKAEKAALRAAAKAALPAKKKAKALKPINYGAGHPKGEKHHNAKLSNKDRKKIITTWNKGAVSQGMLARKYQVNQSTIRHVLMNNQWVLGA